MRKSFQNFSILTLIIALSFIVMISQEVSNPVHAEEYDFVAGIRNEVTFHFRDGIETVNFPVFSTTSDIVSNVGTSFEVEGVVGNNPYLHKALDEAYLYRMSTLTGGNSFEYNYRYFDVDVNVVQNEIILKSFKYNNCEISGYGLSTLTDDYESYLAPDTGFAIVNNIQFRCSGVGINLSSDKSDLNSMSRSFVDYGSLPFTLAEDVRTFLTFEFDHGSEKIESVIFTLTSGFNEANDSGPSFQIITAVLPHPLIDDAIDKSRKVSGMASVFNEDFDVSVEFTNSQEILRGLDFKDCIVSGYDILTLRDKEEGYTGKRGFATAEILDVACSGLTPVNPAFDNLHDAKESRYSQMSNTHTTNSYNMGNGPHIIATFDFNSGTEVVDFPEFYQGNLIARANPTFTLVGVPGVTPLLYDVVDRTRESGSKSTGVSSQVELFDVNLVLVYGDDVVRGFDYTKCRIVDYMVRTEHDGEESFYKGFALTDEFYFECHGYEPFDPKYDALFDAPHAKTESSLNWKEKQRDTWGSNFR
ncbi:hypothetical protein NZNM25_09830 [Nitrosopumilus zosterae]|uniref:Uncharacterized protein n=3 Tax=Nitrosopumilus zosterae TaxID=718286 RepID=A0A2S2KR91_9ARCH|nr:hypothetical protein NZNM25_09830 [Nitrosopumilus zosterae]